jgi:hypothetical protein
MRARYDMVIMLGLFFVPVVLAMLVAGPIKIALPIVGLLLLTLWLFRKRREPTN